MRRRPPRSTRTDTPCPYTPLFRSPEFGARPATIFVQPVPAYIEPFATTTGPQMPLHARTAWTRTLCQLAIVLAVALLAGVLAGYPWQVLTVAALGIVALHSWRLRGLLLRAASRPRVATLPRKSGRSADTRRREEAATRCSSSWGPTHIQKKQ